MKPVPGRVFELIGNRFPERTAGDLGQSVENLLTTRDPEHIKAAKRVERIQSLGGFSLNGSLRHTHNGYEYKEINNFLNIRRGKCPSPSSWHGYLTGTL